MKPFLEQIETGNNSSIKVNTYVQNLIDVPLHYHPEHEIVYIQNGFGNLYIGEKEETFNKGDLFFIGGNVPHLFHEAYDAINVRKNSEVYVVQFSQTLYDQLASLPEFDFIREFQRSIGCGIRMKATMAMKQTLKNLTCSSGIYRLHFLSELMHQIRSHNSYSSMGEGMGKNPSNQMAHIRLLKVKAFLAEYSHRDVSIQEAAAVIHLNKTSFCRFLKRETGKTFSEHLNALRIQHACKLLSDSDMGIMDICYAVGYTNPAYFFRQFKKLRHTTPKAYRDRLNSSNFL